LDGHCACQEQAPEAQSSFLRHIRHTRGVRLSKTHKKHKGRLVNTDEPPGKVSSMIALDLPN
jgi:hypothetical protein